MKMIFYFLLMSSTFQIQAQEVASTPAAPVEDLSESIKSNYQINSLYKAGMFLIYDCQGEHYACVDSDGYKKCREERDESIQKKEKRYPCSPLKKFENKKACLKKNYEVIEMVAIKRFCYPK